MNRDYWIGHRYSIEIGCDVVACLVENLRKVARRSVVFWRRRVLTARGLGLPRANAALCAASSYTCPPGRRQLRPRYIIVTGELDVGHLVVTAFRYENIFEKAPSTRSPPPWRLSDTNSFSSATPRERGSSWGETCK